MILCGPFFSYLFIVNLMCYFCFIKKFINQHMNADIFTRVVDEEVSKINLRSNRLADSYTFIMLCESAQIERSQDLEMSNYTR